MKQCNCKNLNNWMTCVVCDGRIHKKECTTKMNPEKDCCERRHKLLYNRGYTKGIVDSSINMLDSKSYIHK